MKTTSEIIAALHSEDDSERSYALQIAGDLLREATPDLMRVPSAEQLKAALLDALLREQDPSQAATLIYTLGKSFDPQLKPLYLQHLQRFTKSILAANFGVFQVLIALDNLGEPVFEKDAKGRGSQSVTNVEKNLRQARTYLSRHEIELPW